jgi:hypothetical protein
MTENTPTTDSLDWTEKEKKLPDMLNVLTILTFIGCGIGLISSIWGYVGAQKGYDTALDLQSKMDNMPDYAKRMMGPDPVGMARKTLENRMPILLLSLVAIALCLYGAMQMRKRKKSGFSLYLIGEILPIITTFIFLGVGLLSGFTLAIALLFPIVFIILYATQLKHLA